MLDFAHYAALGLESAARKVLDGERLAPEEGLALFRCPDHVAVGALAHHARTRLHGQQAYYVVNRHINYSNHCVNACLFCAFRRDPGEEGAFTLSRAEILDRLCDENGEDGAPCAPPDEIHIVGSCHPSLPLAWYEDLVRLVRDEVPSAAVKAFTCVEIAHFAALEGISTLEVLRRLKDAGLAMMPGGGAEIFAPAVRARLCPDKIDADTWLRIAGEAHSLGIPGNATMLFGHVESCADRVDHLCRLREQQDRTGGFLCFIPLAFQTEHSALKLPEGVSGPQRGLDQLRTIAVSRLMLDNIPHVKAYWVMLGIKQAQTALYWGADDLDGTIVEEKIGHMAGADSAQALEVEELESMIRLSGFEPVRRSAKFAGLSGGFSGIAPERGCGK
jgi:aminodeoxyfutalosine synthase